MDGCGACCTSSMLIWESLETRDCAGFVGKEDSGDPCCWLGAVPVA